MAKSAWPRASMAESRPRPSRWNATSTTGQTRLGEGDFGDFDFSEALAVAVELADALLGLIAEDENLFVLALPHDGAGDAGAVDYRGADLQVAAAARNHHAVEGDVGADLRIEEIAPND